MSELMPVVVVLSIRLARALIVQIKSILCYIYGIEKEGGYAVERHAFVVTEGYHLGSSAGSHYNDKETDEYYFTKKQGEY